MIVKGGYIDYFLIFLKPLIDLQHGLYFAIFIKRLNKLPIAPNLDTFFDRKQVYSILTDPRGTIFGVTKNLIEDYGFPNETLAQNVKLNERLNIAKISQDCIDNEFHLLDTGYKIRMNFCFERDNYGGEATRSFLVFCGLTKLSNRYDSRHDLLAYRFTVLHEIASHEKLHLSVAGFSHV